MRCHKDSQGNPLKSGSTITLTDILFNRELQTYSKNDFAFLVNNIGRDFQDSDSSGI